MILKLFIDHQGLKVYRVYINDELGFNRDLLHGKVNLLIVLIPDQ